jgi:lipoate-protein ligase A
MSYKLKWRLIDSGFCSAAYNMAIDEAIAIAVRHGDSPPSLRFYGWDAPAVSIGAFQKITEINLKFCKNNNILVVRRPTGGRGILHGDELTYSFSSRNEGWFSESLLKTYQKLSEAFQSAFNKIGLTVTMKMERESGRNLTRSPLCFKSASYGEIIFDGKKLIGSSQKRWKDGFLQQGSIPYSIDYEKLQAVFRENSAEVQRHREPEVKNLIDTTSETTGFQAMAGLKEILPDFDDAEFKNRLKESFEKTFKITLFESHLFPHEEEIAHRLFSEKYQNPQWTQGTLRNIQSCNNSETLKKAL